MITTPNVQPLKSAVRGAYDLQKLRMQAGLRLCANFRAKLGQTAGTKEKDIDAEAQDMLDQIRDSFVRLTDGIAKNRNLPAKEGFHGDDLITDYAELVLVSQYVALLETEKRQFRDLPKLLEDFPIYTEYLADVKGVGPAMAAVLISEIDITRCRYPSSMHTYAGLDVVTKWKLTAQTWEVAGTTAPPVVLFPTEPHSLLPHMTDEELDARVPYAPRNEAVVDGNVWTVAHAVNDAGVTEGIVRINAPGGWVLRLEYEQEGKRGRSRRKEHLVQREYTNKDGDLATRASITYNPFLKTKLMGVLAGSFLRSGSEWREVYDGIKHRYSTDPAKIAGENAWTKGHIHQAAMRYMVKQFLISLYRHWRPLAGLPVYPSYAEAKLGLVHSRDDIRDVA